MPSSQSIWEQILLELSTLWCELTTFPPGQVPILLAATGVAAPRKATAMMSTSASPLFGQFARAGSSSLISCIRAQQTRAFQSHAAEAIIQKSPLSKVTTGTGLQNHASSSSSHAQLLRSPLARSFGTQYTARQTFGSTLQPRLRPVATFVGLNSSRGLFGASWGSNSNRNHLANLELTANNNPNSPTAQNAFYQVLLRQNMPEIIVERYQTGRYATSPAVDAVYNRALEKIGSQEIGNGALGGLSGKSSIGQGQQMTPEQLQAIGQAVAAQTRGGNVAISHRNNGNTGGKNEPLYVVVEETWRTTLLSWAKTLIYWAMIFYVFNVIITIAVEFFSLAKKISPTTNAEAKPELQTARFSDVHGCDEAKEELQELVEFLRAPDKFSTLGGKLPKGVLLVGPPGTGKTLLARAVAGEAGVPFFYMSGSEFDEMFVGVGAKRVRELFAAARAKSPSIIFIDELDAVGGKRNEREPGYAKQTLNQLLTELDGFDQTSGVILIGATNFPKSLDKALTRPGRFDRNVSVPLPDVRGRIAILKHHLKNVKIDASVDPAVIARGCPGFSGAELENVVNQAAVHASKNKSTKVTEADLVWAKDKVLMGAERRSAVIQAKDKLMTAYHEGGHALVAMLTEAHDPLYKATIMPRGQSLGTTHFLPELDKVSMSKRELMARIDVSMGGKMAEELIYGADNVTTGASSDITAATNVAYHMVTQAGMSEALGNIDLDNNYSKLSSETKQKIENEVRRLVEEGRARALKLLTDNREGLDRLANALVEYETLDREEIEKVVRGEKLTGKPKSDGGANVKLPDNDQSPPSPPPISIPPGSIGLPGIGGRGSGVETGQSKKASNS